MLLVTAGLLMLPVAVASDDSTNQTPDDHAWVEDCPPDMLCAASEGNATAPHTECPDGASDCMPTKAPGGPRPTNATSDNCMDGQQAGESCDPDVYYLGGHSGGAPTPVPPTNDSADVASQDARAVPAPSVVVALGIVAAAALAVAVLSGRR